MRDRLVMLAKAGYSGIVVQTSEEARVEVEVAGAAKELKRGLYDWACTKGLMMETRVIAGGDPMEALPAVLGLKNAVVLMRDFTAYFDSPLITRWVRDILKAFRAQSSLLILVGPTMKLPPEVIKEFQPVDFTLPDAVTLNVVVDGILSGLDGKVKVSIEQRKAAIAAAQGLTTLEAENAFALSLVEKKSLDPETIIRCKVEALKKSQILEYYPPRTTMNAVGGLEGLKSWASKRARSFSEEARKFGLPNPKGVLLVGPPGTGKSLTSKAIAALWGRPLLRFDVGRVFGSLVGQSEAAMREALATAEAMAPCVLWIDELEKAFAGSKGGGQFDSGVGTRVFGTFLTWLSEKATQVFVVATANDVQSLPAELLRKGRFDEIFCIDLPNADERETILGIHLTQRGRKPADFNVKALSKAADGYSGSEIEASIESALFDAFDANRELQDGDVEQALKDTVPLSRSMAEGLKAMRAWATSFARPAGKVEVAGKHSGRALQV